MQYIIEDSHDRSRIRFHLHYLPIVPAWQNILSHDYSYSVLELCCFHYEIDIEREIVEILLLVFGTV
jgi:hypothetical protein